jgi:hypothetical protein
MRRCVPGERAAGALARVGAGRGQVLNGRKAVVAMGSARRGRRSLVVVKGGRGTARRQTAVVGAWIRIQVPSIPVGGRGRRRRRGVVEHGRPDVVEAAGSGSLLARVVLSVVLPLAPVLDMQLIERRRRGAGLVGALSQCQAAMDEQRSRVDGGRILQAEVAGDVER